MNFKEWMSSSTVSSLAKLRTAINQTRLLFDTLLKMFNVHEAKASYGVAQDTEHYVLPSKEFQNYFQPYGQLIKTSYGGYSRMCGDDGCAYFSNKKIAIKFCRDHKEFAIANAVKGNLKTLPIIDAAEWEIEADESVLYSITMRELDISGSVYRPAFREAGDIIASVCDRLQDLVKKKPNIPEEYIRRRLSMAYMLRHTERKTPEVVEALKDFVRVLRLVYEKSGILVGADWERGRNFGVTKKLRVQPFDFGRGSRHVRREEPPINSIQIKSKELS